MAVRVGINGFGRMAGSGLQFSGLIFVQVELAGRTNGMTRPLGTSSFASEQQECSA